MLDTAWISAGFDVAGQPAAAPVPACAAAAVVAAALVVAAAADQHLRKEVVVA
jgi:hypothetical protein